MRGHQPTINYFENIISSKVELSISSIVELEIFVGKSSANFELEKKIEALLGKFRKIPVDGKIAKKAGILKRDLGISAFDAVIAATAIIDGLILVTRNEKHFLTIPGLKIINPSTDRRG